MNCKKCGTKAIVNEANYKKFWFCKVCREEVPSEEFLLFPEDSEPFELDSEYDAWLDKINGNTLGDDLQ